MGRKQNQYFANRVVHFYKNITFRDKKSTVQHFVAEGKSQSTIYKILRRYEDTGETQYRKIPGRPRTISTPRNISRVKRAFTKNRTTSVRITSRKLKIARSTVSKIKVHDLGFKARTKKKAPKYVKNQEQRAKTGLRKIYKKVLEKVLVIDDETYVTFDPSQIPGRKFYHASDDCEVSYDDQFKTVTKFPKKYLVWQALDEQGKTWQFCTKKRESTKRATGQRN